PPPHAASPPFPTRRSSDLRKKARLRRDVRPKCPGYCNAPVYALWPSLLGVRAAIVRASFNLGVVWSTAGQTQTLTGTRGGMATGDRKSTRLNSSHVEISYA